MGVVIGKGGDMIKKIQGETGARVQFQQGRDDGPGDRRCLLTGKPEQVEDARQRIEELIDSVLVSANLSDCMTLSTNCWSSYLPKMDSLFCLLYNFVKRVY